jgi:hypothetical protein
MMIRLIFQMDASPESQRPGIFGTLSAQSIPTENAVCRDFGGSGITPSALPL